MEFIPICSCWEGAGIAASDGTGDQPELHFGGHEPPFMAQLFSHGGMLCFAFDKERNRAGGVYNFSNPIIAVPQRRKRPRKGRKTQDFTKLQRMGF